MQVTPPIDSPDSGALVEVQPRWFGAVALWAGSDHYGLGAAIQLDAFSFPAASVLRVYRIDFAEFRGLASDRYLVEYLSPSRRECVVLLDHLPAALRGHSVETVAPVGALLLYLRQFWREPSAMLLPLTLPLVICLMMSLFAVWDQLVLRNPDFLAFFARPGCESGCVRKVLSLHSLVGLLFLIQILLLLMPISFLFFHAPRYRSAFNYRITQTYSVVTAVLGIFVFAQLMVFFPFKQYGRFIRLGLDPKVERVLSHLKEQKDKVSH